MAGVKWEFVVPMLLMSFVGLGMLVATMGQIVYGTLFFTKVSHPLWLSYAGNSLAVQTMMLIVFLILGLVLMILSIVTGQVLILMGLALAAELTSAVFAIIVALNTAPTMRPLARAEIEGNYSLLDTRQFEAQYQCHGVRVGGCVSNCCDESLEYWLSFIFTYFSHDDPLRYDPPFMLVFSLFWCTMMIILIPSVIGMVSKRRENEKKFKKNW